MQNVFSEGMNDHNENDNDTPREGLDGLDDLDDLDYLDDLDDLDDVKPAHCASRPDPTIVTARTDAALSVTPQSENKSCWW